jgi:hypothetical protein
VRLTEVIKNLLTFGSPDPKPVDYGGGLYRIPDAPTGKVFDGHPGEYIPVAEWATRRWEAYEAGRHSYSSTGDGPEICPFCYYLGMVETSRLLSTSHHDNGARRRWARSVTEYEAQIEALGGCRCEQKLTAGQAAFEAREFNRPYYPGIT